MQGILQNQTRNLLHCHQFSSELGESSAKLLLNEFAANFSIFSLYIAYVLITLDLCERQQQQCRTLIFEVNTKSGHKKNLYKQSNQNNFDEKNMHRYTYSYFDPHSVDPVKRGSLYRE